MNKLLLIIILIFGFILRIYQSDTYPPLLWDEAANGYNAYSILQTGRDEYGVKLPLIFKSFGDYKPGIYTYLTVPFVAIFGLNQLSVRLPSIIFGSLLPLLIYYFLLHFFPNNKKLALIAAFITATNPANIHFSRGGWETNILLFQLVLSSLLFFKKKFIFSALILVLAFYTYQSAKIFIPFSIFNLFLFTFIKSKKIYININLIVFLLIIVLGSVPMIIGLISNNNSNRLQMLSIFSYPPPVGQNRIVYFTNQIASRYFNHLSPRLLLSEGDWSNPRHSAPYTGIILFPSFIFLLLGLFFAKVKDKSILIFFLLWLIFSPLPSSLTRDQTQLVRSFPITIPLIIFISLGINQIIKLTSIKYKNLLILVILIIYSTSLVYYLDLYFNHMVKKSPTDFLYGYKPAIDYVIKNQSKYDQIYFTNFYGQPYIYYLFYSHYLSSKYQSQSNLIQTSIDVGHIAKLDNLVFGVIDWRSLPPKTLLIVSLEEYRRLLLSPLDQSKFIPLSPIGDLSTFYAYVTN